MLPNLVGGDILNTILKTANRTDNRSISNYRLHNVIKLALDNATRPNIDNVLNVVKELYNYSFDFCKTVKHKLTMLIEITIHI